jgi:adenosylmethionine-8-amino-7-oxononanoate aminotransferase
VLADVLRTLESHPAVSEVRTGVGLLGGVELADPSKLQAVIDAAYERGVLIRGIRGVALQISPPFVITEEEIATLGRVLGESLDAAA